jgi:ABC-type bacteriocin/lantibiotic exporter with double-glycine peptidase domain
MNHQWQTFNNCHRASVAIALGYYGYQISQHTVRFQYGLGHCQVPDFVSRYGLVARVYRFPLARDRKVLAIRQLLALGVPVIVLQRVSIGSSTYHFRVVHGYDGAASEFICDDSLLGPDHRIPYDTFVRLGGTLLIPIYRPRLDAHVQSLLRELGASRWTDEDGRTCDALESR